MSARLPALFTLLLAAAFAPGCAQFQEFANAPMDKRPQTEIIKEKIKVVATEINYRLRSFEPTEKTIAVTTFVDLDNLDVASSFGRFLAEELASEMHTLGYNVRELRQRQGVEVVEQKGEFILTRRSEELMKSARIDAALTGTYMVVGDNVVVNARIVDLDSSMVISVGQMTANLRELGDIRELLAKSGQGAAPVVKVVAMEKR